MNLSPGSKVKDVSRETGTKIKQDETSDSVMIKGNERSSAFKAVEAIRHECPTTISFIITTSSAMMNKYSYDVTISSLNRIFEGKGIEVSSTNIFWNNFMFLFLS